ncbi:cytochrome c oxidase assembly protein [Paenibacillus athensensis]|uniref:Cytochrome C oxidase assembly protein n=1 Tax=Paenibacillus athensensis TaxID=1967502 RepID=A0A4Y8PYE3_9BACL|nr:cytochrome c oxidase assembly protein [Paenibacillus athensensis]MCD1259700.1 cytochrome c oxidase assembly protein [Paenibacillus athensensis]
MNLGGGFFELWSPVVLLFVIVAGYAYHRWTGSPQAGQADELRVPLSQKLSFYTGLVLFYIGQGSPINFIGHHYLFSVHMLQQTMLFLIVPIFIWLGTPERLFQSLLRSKVFKALFHFFTRPFIALFLFNILFSIYHLPLVMNALMANELMYFGYHIVLFASAFAMWYPVFPVVRDERELSDLKKMAYTFGNGILLTPACALIIFADSVIYDMYQNVTIPFAHLSTLDDQQLGGVIMKIIQEIVYAAVLAYTFFKWYRRERGKEDDYPDGYVADGPTEA